MPIIRFKNKIVYFSHIPKCGGTSIENFLKIIVGDELSFLDRDFYGNNYIPWSSSSPQHITGNYVVKLFPVKFFDEFFTVTRNPFDRFCSAFYFQKYHEKKINMGIDINQFAINLLEGNALLTGQFDNHFLPQVKFLYPGASYKAFKLENGLSVVRRYIGSLFDMDVNDIPIPHSQRRQSQIGINSENLNNHSKKIIKEIYKIDFEKFNY